MQIQQVFTHRLRLATRHFLRMHQVHTRQRKAGLAAGTVDHRLLGLVGEMLHCHLHVGAADGLGHRRRVQDQHIDAVVQQWRERLIQRREFFRQGHWRTAVYRRHIVHGFWRRVPKHMAGQARAGWRQGDPVTAIHAGNGPHQAILVCREDGTAAVTVT